MYCRPIYVCAAVVVAVCVSVLAGCGGDESKPAHVDLPDFTGLVKRVSPAVVNISARPAEDDADAQSDTGPQDSQRRFFEGTPGAPPRGMPRASLGSGFIISADGTILTNRHVIADAGRIIVKLNDRRQLLAQVVGQDRYSDLAVLKVAADDLPTVAIGNPKKLEVGSWVVAIGSPFGFETSVTAGIVSAKRRSLADDQYVPFLQTDVAINPGNSGGPLFDLAGEVVGINSQIYSRTGGFQGVSFAIPIDIAMDVARQLRHGGHVTRGWLGVQIQDVGRRLAEVFHLKRPEGALVTRTIAGSPAAKAGLRHGDVILAFNGHRVDSASMLPPLVSRVAPGQHAKITLLRDGARRTVVVAIEALPGHLLAQKGSPAPAGAPRKPYGLTLGPLSDSQRDKKGIAGGGVEIGGVAAGAAKRAGLRAGDIVLAVGHERVADAPALRRALAAADGPVALLVLRDARRLYLVVRPDNAQAKAG